MSSGPRGPIFIYICVKHSSTLGKILSTNLMDKILQLSENYRFVAVKLQHFSIKNVPFCQSFWRTLFENCLPFKFFGGKTYV